MSIDQFHFLLFIKTDFLDFKCLLKRLPLTKLLLQMHNPVTRLPLLCYCIGEHKKYIKFGNIDTASANFMTHVYIASDNFLTLVYIVTHLLHHLITLVL